MRFSDAALDEEFVTELAFRRVERGLVRRLDAGGGFGPEYLVGALADDAVAGEVREAFEGAVGEDVAAILDVLGGDAHRNVVEHRFQELRGRGKLARQPTLAGAVLMRRDRPTVGQRKMLDQDRFAIGQFGDQPLRAGSAVIELLDADVEQAALAPHLQQFRPGHVAGDVGARQPINIEVAIVAEHDSPLRIDHHDALVEMVQGGTDEGVAAELRPPGLAQRRKHPDPDGTEKGSHRNAADQKLPDDVRIERADIAGRRQSRMRPMPNRPAPQG